MPPGPSPWCKRASTMSSGAIPPSASACRAAASAPPVSRSGHCVVSTRRRPVGPSIFARSSWLVAVSGGAYAAGGWRITPSSPQAAEPTRQRDGLFDAAHPWARTVRTRRRFLDNGSLSIVGGVLNLVGRTALVLGGMVSAVHLVSAFVGRAVRSRRDPSRLSLRRGQCRREAGPSRPGAACAWSLPPARAVADRRLSGARRVQPVERRAAKPADSACHRPGRCRRGPVAVPGRGADLHRLRAAHARRHSRPRSCRRRRRTAGRGVRPGCAGRGRRRVVRSRSNDPGCVSEAALLAGVDDRVRGQGARCPGVRLPQCVDVVAVAGDGRAVAGLGRGHRVVGRAGMHRCPSADSGRGVPQAACGNVRARRRAPRAPRTDAVLGRATLVGVLARTDRDPS